MAMKFKIKKKKQNKVIKFFKRRINENGGLFTAFAISSIIGFLIQSINLAIQKDISTSFMYVSVILGIGFIIEADIKQAFKRKKVRILLPKLFTLLVGILLLISGLASIPFLGITFGPTIIGILSFLNFIAAFALIMEFIWID